MCISSTCTKFLFHGLLLILDIGIIITVFRFVLGSKPKSKPKKERTKEEITFRRRAKYFLVTQLVAVLLFLTLMGRPEDAEIELDDDDEGLD